MKVNESVLAYMADTKAENDVILAALAILEKRMSRDMQALESPHDVHNYLCLKLGAEKREVFAVLYLNTRHAVIAFETPFAGTLTRTSVYPREIIKRALELNACSVVFSHNHPSGKPWPSPADEHLTQTLKAGLALVDVRVLDHIVVVGALSFSFAERGLL